MAEPDPEDEYGEELGGDPVGETGDASTSALNFGSLLTNSESVDGLNFQLASGINATRVAQTIIGSVVFSVLLGGNSVISAVSTAYARLIDALAGFFGDRLIEATLGAGVSAIEGAWAFSLEQYGAGAYLAALGLVIATFYVADWGLDTAREVL